jgi:hypothetical protein
MNSLIIIGTLMTLFCIITFGIYSVVEENLCLMTLFSVVYLIWILVFHGILYILNSHHKSTITIEIVLIFMSFIYVLIMKRKENLFDVRVDDIDKNINTIYGNLPYNPYYV